MEDIMPEEQLTDTLENAFVKTLFHISQTIAPIDIDITEKWNDPVRIPAMQLFQTSVLCISIFPDKTMIAKKDGPCYTILVHLFKQLAFTGCSACIMTMCIDQIKHGCTSSTMLPWRPVNRTASLKLS